MVKGPEKTKGPLMVYPGTAVFQQTRPDCTFFQYYYNMTRIEEQS